MARAATLTARDTAVVTLPVSSTRARAIVALTMRGLTIGRHSVATTPKARALLRATSRLSPPLSTVAHTIFLACTVTRASARRPRTS